MVVALGPGRFYGSSLPRPRFYTDLKFNSERIDPPTTVSDPLLSWANDAHWSMGGLSFSRHRLQGRIEGNITKLRAQKKREQKSKSVSPLVDKKARVSGQKPQNMTGLRDDDDDLLSEEEEMVVEKVEKKMDKNVEKKMEKKVEKKMEKKVEKKMEKAEKKVEKKMEKKAEKKMEKKAEKKIEKNAEKKIEKNAEKKIEKKVEKKAEKKRRVRRLGEEFDRIAQEGEPGIFGESGRLSRIGKRRRLIIEDEEEMNKVAEKSESPRRISPRLRK